MSTPPELVAAFWGLCIAALVAVTGIVAAVGIGVARYLQEVIDDRREDIAAKRRARQMQAGVEVAAVVDEETRGANALSLTADQKLSRAVQKLAAIEPELKAPELIDVVHRGVATLRGSLPYPTTYQSTPSIPPPADVVTPGKRRGN